MSNADKSPLTLEQQKQKAKETMQMALESFGIDDVNAYLDQKEKELEGTPLYRTNKGGLMMRGSVHLMMDRYVTRGEVNERIRKHDR